METIKQADAPEQLPETVPEPVVTLPEAERRIGNRVLSPEAAAALKKGLAEFAKGAEPTETAADPAPEPRESAPAPDSTPAPAAEKTPTAPEYPAHVVDAIVRVSDMQQKLERQQADLKPKLEKIGRLDSLRGKFADDRIAAVREALEVIGVDAADQVLADLVDDYTRHILKIEPTSDSKALSEARRARAEVEALKQERERKAQEDRDEAERREREAYEKSNMEQIGQALKSAEAYPYLRTLALATAGADSDESDAGELYAGGLVWDEIVREHARTGETITLQAAAQRVEARERRRAERYRDLLSPQAPAEPQQEAAPSDRPRTISQSMTSAPSAPPGTRHQRETRTLDNRDRRREALAMVAQAVARERSS